MAVAALPGAPVFAFEHQWPVLDDNLHAIQYSAYTISDAFWHLARDASWQSTCTRKCRRRLPRLANGSSSPLKEKWGPREIGLSLSTINDRASNSQISSFVSDQENMTFRLRL